ncbi:delta-60 repeat domain-containing protein [Lysobacter sp. CA199]|uniref:delta-60 repeat domain-containing protein n=1 Tax=Lysobacter sp. CA199 TaxID=3455608 RepID=UPI003F8D04D6
MTSPHCFFAALACAAALICASSAQPARAQSAAPEGGLDRGFGVDGRFVDDYPGSYFQSSAIAVQRDGKILVVSNAGGWPRPRCRLLRLLPDGGLDPAFGDGGATWVGDESGVVCHSLAVRADGKIVIAGYATNTFMTFRHLADGSLDKGFGDGGVARADFTDLGFPETIAWDMAVQRDGKIVVVGGAEDPRVSPKRSRFAVVRLGEDGRLDPDFGDGGRVLTSFADYSERAAAAYSVAVQADGRIVVVGSLAATQATALARYLPDGRLDPSFGQGGRTASYGNRGGHMLAIQADGGLLTMHSMMGGDGHTAIERHLADGSADASYQKTPILGLTTGLKLQADGRLLVVGQSSAPGRSKPFLIRLNQDGTRDTSFEMEPFSFVADGADFFYGVGLQPGGKILVLAFSQARTGGGHTVMGLARLRATTHCIADALDPDRYLGFSPDGWFATAGRDRKGPNFGALGRGRTTSLPAAGLHLFQARDVAGVSADAAVFATEPGRGWGLGRVRASAPADARFAILDPRLDDSACGIGRR